MWLCLGLVRDLGLVLVQDLDPDDVVVHDPGNVLTVAADRVRTVRVRAGNHDHVARARVVVPIADRDPVPDPNEGKF